MTFQVLELHLGNSPDDDDHKVQHVPAVSHVGVLMHDQAVGNNLQKCLDCENNQEGIFDCFLHGGEKEEEKRSRGRKGEGSGCGWGVGV